MILLEITNGALNEIYRNMEIAHLQKISIDIKNINHLRQIYIATIRALKQYNGICDNRK